MLLSERIRAYPHSQIHKKHSTIHTDSTRTDRHTETDTHTHTHARTYTHLHTHTHIHTHKHTHDSGIPFGLHHTPPVHLSILNAHPKPSLNITFGLVLPGY